MDTAEILHLRSKVQELQAEVEKYRTGYVRYETARRLNPRQWKVLWEHNLRTGEGFDQLIDQLTTTYPDFYLDYRLGPSTWYNEPTD